MTTIIGFVTALATEAFAVGNQLITFITAEGHELVLIPIATMLLVTCVGMIRKLIKGV